MNCQECGRPLSEGSKFCKACGAPVGATAPGRQGAPVPNECPFCKAALKPNARFCATCGNSLTAGMPPPRKAPPLCPSCGTPVKPGKRFCGTCGATIVPASPDSSAQRAPLTSDSGPIQDQQVTQPPDVGAPPEQRRSAARLAAPPATTETSATTPAQPMTLPRPISPPPPGMKGSPEKEPQGPPTRVRQPEPVSPEPRPVRPAVPSCAAAAPDQARKTGVTPENVPPKGGTARSRRLIILLASAGGVLVIGIATVALLFLFGVLSPYSGRPAAPLTPLPGGSSPVQGNPPGQASSRPGAENPGVQGGSPTEQSQPSPTPPTAPPNIPATEPSVGSAQAQAGFQPSVTFQPSASSPEPSAVKVPVRPKAPPRPKFVDVTELDAKPTPQTAPQLKYTEQAVDAQVKGTVVLEVSIDETGRVTDCTLVQGPTPDYGMDQVCLDAAKSLVYSIPVQRGLPAKTRLLLPMVLDPPAKPKPAPVKDLTSLGVIVEAKANLGRFQLLVDQKVVWESSLLGSLGEAKRATKELQFPAGTHQVELLAWMPNATKPFGTSGTYTGATGEHHVVKYYVTIFGNIKGGMVQ